jgi:predicted nucleic acid-binding protein
MIGVVDTSALIRLFVPDGPMADGFEDFLYGIERGINTAIAPELLIVEAANVLNKKQISGELSGDESYRLLADLLSVPIRIFPHRPLIQRAFDLARKYQLSVYGTFSLLVQKYILTRKFICITLNKKIIQI